LTRLLEEARAANARIPVPQNVVKRVKKLEDQVRARDLVIELMYVPSLDIP
jgi:hypothetical protein